jgi:pyruvate/2-oxoglutarate dehydrogenase complex dihydrolipoamide acyltransferase (E2) component
MPRRAISLRIGTALALVLVLAGCTKGGAFDPTEIFNTDAFDTKKKMKGDRELVFPNGVPGATTGVPPDLIKGYQAPPDQSDDAALPPAPPEPAKTAAAKPKPKPKPKVAAAPAAQQQQQQQDPVWNQKAGGPNRINVGGTPAAAPSAQAPSAQAPGAAAPWPAPQQTQQTGQSVWPSPPATTTR